MVVEVGTDDESAAVAAGTAEREETGDASAVLVVLDGGATESVVVGGAKVGMTVEMMFGALRQHSKNRDAF